MTIEEKIKIISDVLYEHMPHTVWMCTCGWKVDENSAKVFEWQMRLHLAEKIEFALREFIKFEIPSELHREEFERWVLTTRKQTQPFGLVERTKEDGYLDLYTQKEWTGWKAAMQLRQVKSISQECKALNEIFSITHRELGMDEGV